MWKAAEKQKNELREEFFKLATEEAKQKPLSQMTHVVYGPTQEMADKRVIEIYPTWTVMHVEQDKAEGWFKYLLQENPKYSSWTFVNPEDGKVYSRQVTTSVMLDEERMQEVDPDLYEAVTDIKKERVMRPTEELTDEQLALVSEYVYEGKPRLKLAAPRKAKPEDYES
jgi:hypothetical protein